MNMPFERYEEILEKSALQLKMGKVKKVIGLIIHAAGLKVFVGEVCDILIGEDNRISAEVVGFQDESVLLMPLGDVQGIGPGCLVLPTGKALQVKVGEELLGTTLDGLGNPMDKKKRRLEGYCDIYRTPPNPFERKKIETVMSTGVKAIDGILTCGEGQRGKKYASWDDQPLFRGGCKCHRPHRRKRQGSIGIHRKRPGGRRLQKISCNLRHLGSAASSKA